MQFFSILGRLATITGFVSAIVIPEAPIPEAVIPEAGGMIGRISNPLLHSSREGNIAKRAVASFYFCTDADYQGLCYRDQSALGTCVTVEDELKASPDRFGDNVSSASVNEGIICTLYRDAHCEGPTVTIEFPGQNDLYFQGFNDVMSSFRCEQI